MEENYESNYTGDYLSVNVVGPIQSNIPPVPSIAEIEPRQLIKPDSNDVQLAKEVAEFLVDFLDAPPSLRQGMVNSVVRNFRLALYRNETEGGLYNNRSKLLYVFRYLGRKVGKGQTGILQKTSSSFSSTSAHEFIHLFQELFGFGYSKWESTWFKQETIPYATQMYLVAIGEGQDPRKARSALSRKITDRTLSRVFMTAFEREGTKPPDEIIREIQELVLAGNRGDGPMQYAGAAIAGIAYARYVKTGQWDSGRDFIRSQIIRPDSDPEGLLNDVPAQPSGGEDSPTTPESSPQLDSDSPKGQCKRSKRNG